MSARADLSVITRLAVLRRARRAADFPRALRHGLTHQLLQRIAPRAIRYVGRSTTDERFYLVPATIDLPCLAREPGRLTPAIRRRLRTAAQQDNIRTHRFGLALVSIGPDQAGVSAYSAGSLGSDVGANHLLALFNSAGNRSATLAGIAPDGVVAVRLTYNSQTTTIRIADRTNFWSARVSDPTPDPNAKIAWISRDGRIARRFTGITEASY